MVAICWLALALALAFADVEAGRGLCAAHRICDKPVPASSGTGAVPRNAGGYYDLPPIPTYGQSETNSALVPEEPMHTEPSRAVSRNPLVSGSYGVPLGASNASHIPHETPERSGTTSEKSQLSRSTGTVVTEALTATRSGKSNISGVTTRPDGTATPGRQGASGFLTRSTASHTAPVSPGTVISDYIPTNSDGNDPQSLDATTTYGVTESGGLVATKSKGTAIPSGGSGTHATAPGVWATTGSENPNTSGPAAASPATEGSTVSAEPVLTVSSGTFAGDPNATGSVISAAPTGAPRTDGTSIPSGVSGPEGTASGNLTVPASNKAGLPSEMPEPDQVTTSDRIGTETAAATVSSGSSSGSPAPISAMPSVNGPDGVTISRHSAPTEPSGITLGNPKSTGSNEASAPSRVVRSDTVSPTGSTAVGNPTATVSARSTSSGTSVSSRIANSQDPNTLGSNRTETIGKLSTIADTSTRPQTLGGLPTAAILTTTLAESVPLQTSLGIPQLRTITATGQTDLSLPFIITATFPTSSESILTLTTLLPNATLVTLTDATFISPTFITTTAPGGGKQTVVPVIIPTGGGPPIICFSCIPSFAPNIVIKFPNFCVNIFGFKIGNCPVDNKDNDTDDDNDKGDDDKSSKTRDGPSETFCTTTMVATYESVFCSITGVSIQVTTECSTRAWTTVTDCSVTNSATTTTATTKVKYVEATCAPDTCGLASCPVKKKRSLDLDPSIELIRKRAEADGDWVEPGDMPASSKFTQEEQLVMSQVRLAYTQEKGKGGDFMGQIVKFPDYGEMTTTNYVLFQEEVQSLAVQGLYGCSSVVLVSKRGAFASHIWEGVFSPGDFATFEALAYNALLYGHGDEFSPLGLEQLRNARVSMGYTGTVFGDNTDPSDDPDTRIFIMTPRPRVPVLRDETTGEPIMDKGSFIPSDEVRMDKNAMAGLGLLAAQDSVNEIQKLLRRDFGQNVPIEIVDYSPMVESSEHYIQYLLVGGIPYEAREKILGDSKQATARGKLLVQYHPAKTCNDKAAWRVWFEGRPLDGRTSEWDPEAGQVFRREGQQKRQEACPIKEPPRQTTANSATAQSPRETSAIPPNTLQFTLSTTASSTLRSTTVISTTKTPSGVVSTSLQSTIITSTASAAAPVASVQCKQHSDCGTSACNENQYPVCLKLGTFSDGLCSCVEKSAIGQQCTSNQDCKGHQCDKGSNFECQLKLDQTKGSCQCILAGLTQIPIPVFPTTTSAASTSTTSTSSARPTETITPLDQQAGPWCNDEVDFPGHIDVTQESVIDRSQRICTDVVQDTILGPGESMKRARTSYAGIGFEFSVHWIEGCKTTVEKQDAYNLVPATDNCWQAFFAGWALCNNGGVGGSVDVGCLRYTIRAGV